MFAGLLLPCYLDVPYPNHGLSIEISASVTSAIIPPAVSLIFGHSQAVALIEFYGKIMTRLWKAVLLFNMQTLKESLFLVHESSFLQHVSVSIVFSLVTMENSWEVGLLYQMW